MKGTWAIVVVIIRDYKKWLNLIVEWRPKLHFCSFTTNQSNPYRAPPLVFFRVFSIVAFDKKDVQENELKTDKKLNFSLVKSVIDRVSRTEVECLIASKFVVKLM